MAGATISLKWAVGITADLVRSVGLEVSAGTACRSMEASVLGGHS